MTPNAKEEKVCLDVNVPKTDITTVSGWQDQAALDKVRNLKTQIRLDQTMSIVIIAVEKHFFRS